MATKPIPGLIGKPVGEKPKNIIQLHNTPGLTREFVNIWLTHLRNTQPDQAATIAVLEDVVKLIDVAKDFLEPGPADPGKNNK